MAWPTTQQAHWVKREMTRLGIRETDIEEDFVLSSGPGGQNINKVATCVVLRYMPLGIRIKAREYRTQGANRVAARSLLIARVEELRRAQRAAAVGERELARRQKRRRSRAGQAQVRQDKIQRGRVKQQRRPVARDHDES